MSARRGPNSQFQATHVVTGGSMCLYRNDQDRRFGTDDQHVITELWELPSDIPDAYTRLEAAERRLAAEHVFAWHPEFGYLSPFPDHCGTGLHVWAEFHLEGLSLIGDLQPVRAGIEAMRMTFHGVDADGIHNAGHIFRIWNNATLGLPERKLVRRVMRTFEDLVTQELYARQMLIEDTPRIFEDSIMRALAILRSARLLSPWELFDLLSPIRLAANMGYIAGITGSEVISLMAAQAKKPDLPPPQSIADERRRDNRDAALADRINKRFARVEFTF